MFRKWIERLNCLWITHILYIVSGCLTQFECLCLNKNRFLLGIKYEGIEILGTSEICKNYPTAVWQSWIAHRQKRNIYRRTGFRSVKKVWTFIFHIDIQQFNYRFIEPYFYNKHAQFSWLNRNRYNICGFLKALMYKD